MKKLSLFAVTALVLVSILSGCSGAGNIGPTVDSMEDFQKGEFNEGWLYGMTPDAIYSYALQIVDIKTRLLVLKIWEESLSQLNPSVPIGDQIGKIIIKNERNNSVQLGVEGPINKDWYVDGRKEISDMLPPGNYLKWWSDGNGKQYVYKKDEKGRTTSIKDTLTIGLPTSNYNGITNASGLLIYK